MDRVIELLMDLGKALLIGFAAAAAAALLFFMIGLAVGKGNSSIGLETTKDGLLLIASLCLFLLAGLILAKGKKPEKPAADGWRRHFSLVGLKTVIGLTALAFLLTASGADFLLMKR